MPRRLLGLRPVLRLVGGLVLAVCAPRVGLAQHYESLTWAPDGTALVISLGGNLYRLPLQPTDPAVQLTTEPSRDVYASYAPDGSELAFTSNRDGDDEIYVARPDGSGARPITANDDRDSYPSWSPDGRRIAFMRQHEGLWQLWIMDADGGNAHRLTHSTGNDYNARWSPDGQWLVFESARHGGNQDEIYVIRPDGSGERRLTNTPGNDIFPTWLPDGNHVAYCTIENHHARVSVMRSDGGPATTLLEDACVPVWSPDGKSLAYLISVMGQPETLQVAKADGSDPHEIPGPEARRPGGS